MQNKNIVLSREQLLIKCWGYDYEGESRAVDTHIRRLRDKLGSAADCIKTVIKSGYHISSALSKTSDQNFSKKSLKESIILYSMDSQTQAGTLTTAAAVRCQPLQYAILRLIPAYLVTFAVTAFLVFLILRRIRMSLTKPLEILTRSIESHTAVTPDAPWQEPYTLETYCHAARQELHQVKTELTQLRTALDYAHQAEENRRQLVSGITHELKTPLAVIHSYAEGLQANIAEDRKDLYLSVILEETEKMDSMVLQMLDLSRLEAGKVRLASDSFSLLQLTQTVTEKMTPLPCPKKLWQTYGTPFTALNPPVPKPAPAWDLPLSNVS